MGKGPNEPRGDKETSQTLSARKAMLRIMELISDRNVTDEQLKKMLAAVEKIASESEDEDQHHTT